MIITKLKKSNECPKTLHIERKDMVVIKLVVKYDNFNNMTSYNNRNITSLRTNRHAMKEGRKFKPKLGFKITNSC
jgi:hypothetical protein